MSLVQRSHSGSDIHPFLKLFCMALRAKWGETEVSYSPWIIASSKEQVKNLEEPLALWTAFYCVRTSFLASVTWTISPSLSFLSLCLKYIWWHYPSHPVFVCTLLSTQRDTCTHSCTNEHTHLYHGPLRSCLANTSLGWPPCLKHCPVLMLCSSILLLLTQNLNSLIFWQLFACFLCCVLLYINLTQAGVV